MNRLSNRKILRIGVGGSLALHLVIASFVHAYPVAADQPETPPVITIIHVRAPKPTPPPVFHKIVSVKPRANVASFRPHVHLVRTHADPHAVAVKLPPVGPDVVPTPFIKGSESAASPMPITTTPTMDTPTPKPACSAPDVPAKATAAITPQEPPIASDQGLTGTAKIKVDLDASGTVVGTSVYLSTGSTQLDQAALDAARQSRYAPEQIDCKDVSGSYLFTVEFQ